MSQVDYVETNHPFYRETLHHPRRSAIIHWDDNTRRDQLPRVFNEFIGGTLNSLECQVNIAGGWKGHPESQPTGYFIRDYFKNRVKCSFEGFLAKTEHGSKPSAQGFNLITLDSGNGKRSLSDNWNMPINERWYGPNIEKRISSFQFLDSIHAQMDQHPDSGTTLIDKSKFDMITKNETQALCAAARDNNHEKMIRLLDKGITDINVPGPQGWTPLHFAYKLGNFTCAEILIKNGADLKLKNMSGKTPDQLSQNSIEKDRLNLLWMLARVNLAHDPLHGLRSLALHARHPEVLDPEIRAQVDGTSRDIQDPEKRPSVMSACTQALKSCERKH